MHYLILPRSSNTSARVVYIQWFSHGLKVKNKQIYVMVVFFVRL